MNKSTENHSFGNSIWRRRAMAMVVSLGIVLTGILASLAAGLSQDNAEAERVRKAQLVVRTNQWLENRNLDPSSSADMTEALDLACRMARARGDAC